MARHTPAAEASAIDRGVAPGVGTRMSGAEWLATLDARRRVIRRQGGVYEGQTIEALDDLVRAEHERTRRR